MIRKYRGKIKPLESLKEISTMLLSDQNYRKQLKDYERNPFDVRFHTIEDNLFMLAVATPKAPSIERADSDKDYAKIISNIATRVACSGARHIATTNEDDTKIGILGKIDDPKEVMKMSFRQKGDTIYLVGRYDSNPYSESSAHTLTQIRKVIKRGLISSAHAIASNGIFLTLLESCTPNRLGFDITSDGEMSDKEFLFEDSDYLAIVSVNLDQENDLVEYLYAQGIPVVLLGHVTKGELRVDDFSFGDIGAYLV